MIKFLSRHSKFDLVSFWLHFFNGFLPPSLIWSDVQVQRVLQPRSRPLRHGAGLLLPPQRPPQLQPRVPGRAGRPPAPGPRQPRPRSQAGADILPDL